MGRASRLPRTDKHPPRARGRASAIGTLRPIELSAAPSIEGWACEGFMAAAAQPGRPVRGQHRRVPGGSCGRDDYEAIVPFVLERVRLGAADVSEAIARYQDGRRPEPGRHALARIAQQRDRAATAFVRDRDVAALQATMTRLDDEERQAKVTTRRSEPLPPAELRRTTRLVQQERRTRPGCGASPSSTRTPVLYGLPCAT